MERFPAANVGIVSGDIILAINGMSMSFDKVTDTLIDLDHRELIKKENKFRQIITSSRSVILTIEHDKKRPTSIKVPVAIVGQDMKSFIEKNKTAWDALLKEQAQALNLLTVRIEKAKGNPAELTACREQFDALFQSIVHPWLDIKRYRQKQYVQ